MIHKKGQLLGFTLVEVVISLALGGLILSAILSMFVFFVQAWENKKTPYEAFIEHVEQCTRFLKQEINEITPIADNGAVQPEYYKMVKLVSTQAELTPTYALAKRIRKPLPFVPQIAGTSVAWRALILKPEGLYCVSESPEVEKKRMNEGVENTGKTRTQTFLLSAYVTKIEYGHWDPESGQWTFTSTLFDYWNQFCKKTKYPRPDGIRLQFKKEDWEATRFLKCNNDFITTSVASNRTRNLQQGQRRLQQLMKQTSGSGRKTRE